MSVSSLGAGPPRDRSGADPLPVAEYKIRIGYRERATGRWFVGVVIGIVLVVGALLVQSTGWPTLAVVGVYSIVMLGMAARSAILLVRLRR